MQYYFKPIAKFFSARQDFVSDVSKDVAQILFGVLAVESFTKAIINWNMVLWGIILSTIAWSLGIISFKIK